MVHDDNVVLSSGHEMKARYGSLPDPVSNVGGFVDD
jgi:hypothetical protein